MRTELRPSYAVRGWSVDTLEKTQYGMADGRYGVITTSDGPVWTKFGRQIVSVAYIL